MTDESEKLLYKIEIRIFQCQQPFSATSSSTPSPMGDSGSPSESPNPQSPATLNPDPGGLTGIEIGRDRDRTQDITENDKSPIPPVPSDIFFLQLAKKIPTYIDFHAESKKGMLQALHKNKYLSAPLELKELITPEGKHYLAILKRVYADWIHERRKSLPNTL